MLGRVLEGHCWLCAPPAHVHALPSVPLFQSLDRLIYFFFNELPQDTNLVLALYMFFLC